MSKYAMNTNAAPHCIASKYDPNVGVAPNGITLTMEPQ